MQIEAVTEDTLTRVAAGEKLEHTILKFVTEKKVPIPDAAKAIVAAIPVMSAEFLINVVMTLEENKPPDADLLLVTIPRTLVGKTLELNHVKVGLVSFFLWVDRQIYEEKY